MKRRLLTAVLGIALLAGLARIDAAEPAADKPLKQPVFLFCPYRERYGSWSLYVTLDKTDPSKILSVGLEELAGKNGKDDGYAKVLEAQKNPATERTAIATLDAANFSGGTLSVAQDRALNLNVAPDGKDYKLTFSLRISADGRFEMGGGTRNLILRYNKGLQQWRTYATALEDINGRNIVNGDPLAVTGLAFPVKGTGIYEIAVVLAGSNTPVRVMDK